jgi:anti-anti-sigma regulatory factor
MLQIGNSRYEKNRPIEFFYLNSSVDADVVLVEPSKKRYDIRKARTMTEAISEYFKIGGDGTRKILDLSRVDFVDSEGMYGLKTLQKKYRDMKIIVNDEVHELVKLQELQDFFSLEQGIPIDVYNELQSFRKQLKGVKWKEDYRDFFRKVFKTKKESPYAHSPTSQYSTPPEQAVQSFP